MAESSDVRDQLRRRVLSTNEENSVTDGLDEHPERLIHFSNEPEEVPKRTAAREYIDSRGGKVRLRGEDRLNGWFYWMSRVTGGVRVAEVIPIVLLELCGRG